MKNRHKLGIFLIMAVIILASASMIGAYPYIQRQANSYLNEQKNDDSSQIAAAQNLAPQLVNFTYGLWQEHLQEKAGRIMTPAEIFLPGWKPSFSVNTETEQYLVEEYDAGTQDFTYEMQAAEIPDAFPDSVNYLNELGEGWKINLRELRPYISYEMKDQNGQVLRTNIQEDPKNFWKESASDQDAVDLVITYEHSGNLVVDSINGRDEDQASLDALRNALGSFYYYDPMQNYSYDYTLETGVPFSGPKDITFSLRIHESLVLGSDSQLSDSWHLRNAYLSSGGFLIVFFVLCGLVSLAALLLPCFASLRIGQEKIFRVPLEIVLFIGFCMAGFLLGTMFDLPLSLIIATFDGSLLAFIEQFGFSPSLTVIILWAVHGSLWFFIFGMLYWGITCLRSLFSLGLWHYFKERTICGRICVFLKKCFDRFYESMKAVDWQSSSTKWILKIVIANFILLAGISCLWFFGIAALVIYSLALFFLLRKYWDETYQKYQILLAAINQIAEGNLHVNIDQPLGIFEPFREHLMKIQKGFQTAVDAEVASQKMKTELITNVSHDLKTPLTAIITYINLLKQETIDETERAAYIQILEQKSMRLKVLIEDLFEVSKANSGSTTLELVEVDIVNLMKQVRLELSDQIEKADLDFRWNLPEGRIPLMLDSQKTYRVFTNLLVNILKYAMPGTRAYIDMIKETDPSGRQQAVITLRNISAAELHLSPGQLTERFVRGDESRNTEGSGLGLAIAKSFVELQNGTFVVETEADLFRVMICWDLEANIEADN